MRRIKLIPEEECLCKRQICVQSRTLKLGQILRHLLLRLLISNFIIVMSRDKADLFFAYTEHLTNLLSNTFYTMATANLEECEKICVELLNCTQCETRYDQSSHQPRILPCLHTICTDCLMKSFESNSIECTVCQKSVNIQDSFESLKDDFPIDFTIRDRIEFVGTLNQNKSSICDFCDESKTATYRCKDCENFICETCIKFHNKSNKFKNHITCNLSERSDISEFSHEVFCTKDGHENRPLEIFCTGNGCKRPVCNMCFAIDHSDSGDHQAKDVQDVFKLEMERIFDKYKETEELRHGISEVRKRIKDEISVIQRQKETEQDKMNEFFHPLS
ncbi:TRIM2_3 [Mytilus edulis]|uniref:TRIM2_3 n=1 Tax=Mytilus edulis TaxID=6550 RepID=A0A8S3U0K1_MYTED|nr:TRIM2_3 [Mytilus edulis]